MTGSPRTSRLVLLALGLASLLTACGSGASAHLNGTFASPAHRSCVAGVNGSTLARFDALVGFRVNCVDVYDDAAATWSDWDTPWFIDNHIPADNWSPFAARAGNQLTVSLALIPDAVRSENWLAAGAAGRYDAYARTLARHLVRGHMGGAVIRLATEANGTWEKDSLGTAPAQWHAWAQFWRRTVLAMRAVPGAHFRFIWCIANGYRPIPFADWYPGDDVVDAVGVDVYDQVPAGTTNRFGELASERGGLSAIAAFARAHHKPLTVSEWGLYPVDQHGGGDDPAFVAAMARYVRSAPVASESYFFDGVAAQALAAAPRSLAVFRREFAPRSASVTQP